jgi:uncharacterized damage-inducible protein DinB
MRRMFMYCLVVALLTPGLVTPAPAQEKPAEKPAAPAAAAPATGARAEFLGQVAYFEGRFTRLAEAMPAEKYAWRPGEGVRSVGEVFAHVAAGNYMFLRMLDVQPPAGVDPKAIMAGGNDKAKTVQALKDSFAFMQKSVTALNDADLEKPANFFGQKTTQRGVLFHIAAHLGEHLGQSIAYARMNGVVPPWTAEQQKKAKEKEQHQHEEQPKP